MFLRAGSIFDISFPPPCANSGRPPPEPPTIFAMFFAIFPEWCPFEAASGVTATVKENLSASVLKTITIPEPSFVFRLSMVLFKVSVSRSATLAARTLVPLTSNTSFKRSAVPPDASWDFNLEISFSKSFCLPITRSSLSGSSFVEDLSASLNLSIIFWMP